MEPEPQHVGFLRLGGTPMSKNLERHILAVLRRFDDLCLAVEEERELLAAALATAVLNPPTHSTEEGERCSY